MFDEPSLKAALAEVGYRRLKRHVYRADWSTEVEHFIYFQLYGTPKIFLVARFGVRFAHADLFAIRSLQTYGGPLEQLIRYDGRIDCLMNFSIGMMDGSKGLAPPLTTSEMSGAAVAAKVRNDIEQKLLPVVRNLTSLGRFLSFLLTDVETHPWERCNAAIRAGIIVSLARETGMSPEQIRALLEPHLKQIWEAIRDAPDPDPASYVNKIIQDAFQRPPAV
jgi:hypothetical protein